MAQSTRPAGTGAGRRSGFPRTGTARPTPSRGTTPRAGAPRTRTLPGRRKAAPQSTSQKLFGAVTKALSGSGASKAASKAKPSGAKGPAGLALLGAGAFAALKNKDKLTSMVKGKGSSEPEFTAAPATPTTPVTPVNTSTDNLSSDNSSLDNSPSGIRPIE